MASAKLYPPSPPSEPRTTPLPPLLSTPSGLALVELQGEFNLPRGDDGATVSVAEIGRLEFPDYVSDAAAANDSAWMRRVHLYIGNHQRLTGEVKKLPRAVAVVRRRENRSYESSGGSVQEQGDNLEVVEIVKYKLTFTTRPEPVGMVAAS